MNPIKIYNLKIYNVIRCTRIELYSLRSSSSLSEVLVLKVLCLEFFQCLFHNSSSYAFYVNNLPFTIAKIQKNRIDDVNYSENFCNFCTIIAMGSKSAKDILCIRAYSTTFKKEGRNCID